MGGEIPPLLITIYLIRGYMNIFIAVTLYDDKIFGKCSDSILKNCIALINANHTVMPFYMSDLYIDRARNICVHAFLKSNCDEMIFVDSDLAFDDDAMLKLIEHDKDIVAGCYRYKKNEVEFTGHLDFSRENNCKEEETGLAYMERVPTGFMRIKRSVFERIEEHYQLQPDEREIIPFFATGRQFHGDDNWYGEDVYFCKLWTDMGGVLMCEPNINFNHMGTEEHKGNFFENIMGSAVENIDKAFGGVPGWMVETDMAVLKELAEQCNDVTEVGCWKGRSTKVLLESCKGTVHAVDHFNGSPKDATGVVASLRGNVYEEFMKNVGGYSNLTVHKGSSVDVAKGLNGEMFDMVFIDASHEYEDVKADIEAWLPKCKKFIAGHDYYDGHPGVKKAVDEFAKNRTVKVKGTVWWVEL